MTTFLLDPQVLEEARVLDSLIGDGGKDAEIDAEDLRNYGVKIKHG